MDPRDGEPGGAGGQGQRAAGGLVDPALDVVADGELHLTLANLGAALKILGFNPADVFPEG